MVKGEKNLETVKRAGGKFTQPSTWKNAKTRRGEREDKRALIGGGLYQ